MEYVRQPMNLGEICRNIYQIHKDRVQEGVTLILDNQDEDLIIEEDRNRIAQVITNFLTNAGKFTLSGEIRFGFKVNNQCIRFYVKDTGMGIEEKNLTEIFKRFQETEFLLSRVRVWDCPSVNPSPSRWKAKYGWNPNTGKGSVFHVWLPCLA